MSAKPSKSRKSSAKRRSSPGLPSTPNVPTVGMSASGSQQAVTVSALIVAGVYAYRRLVEPASTTTPTRARGTSIGQLTGHGPPVEVGAFITAWGTAFLVISMIAAAAPGFGGSLALLVATGDLLNNVSYLARDIDTKVSSTTASTAATSTSSHAAPTAERPRTAADGVQSSHEVHRSLGGL